MKHLEAHFKAIYQENHPRVYRMCLGYASGDHMTASDYAQEVFIKVWEHLPSFRKEATISTWIYRITVNTCLISLRKKRSIPFSKVMRTVEITNPENESQSTEKNFKALYRCIDLLTKDNKSIILLELEGIPQKEIANIMGISHEAIRIRIHRIKNELTKCVRQ
ncbi:RNA polymerase sigma factor [Cellulophaga sp. E16_2]|uniref:RNA polymerase, sigma-24 subunit, ECF subfamily n=1 Tax=Cellulophaga algicola (strain DSM 14237 / IC166 / ACAM 630) TaxID=688270 RepID=E6XAE9_CELAD|nr:MULTISPECIES: RNA polymerase sigma factor [Cellulophaga]ADV48848.1 RNA polymerase, sigma-24 subunit, ECF subfamily [Cellulophaga algicola DSM 14237]MBO0591318.1 RNA polymerase sigma factor [Cellulophaga sp. E16_2]